MEDGQNFCDLLIISELSVLTTGWSAHILLVWEIIYVVSWALPILNFHAYLNLEGKNIHISKQNFFRFVEIIMNWKFVTPVIEDNNYCFTMRLHLPVVLAHSKNSHVLWLNHTQPFFSLSLKVSKNRNHFMKTSFLPKTYKIIVRISALWYSGQKSWQ